MTLNLQTKQTFIMQALFMAKGPEFLESIPDSQLKYLEFAVEHLMTKQLTAYEIAETINHIYLLRSKIPNSLRADLLYKLLNTPALLESLIRRGLPTPYLDAQERYLMIGMDEQLLSRVPILTFQTFTLDAETDEETEAEISYVATLLWNQELALDKTKENRAKRMIGNITSVSRAMPKPRRTSAHATSKEQGE